MSLEKFKKFIKKRSRTKKSHCNNVESLIDTDIAHESFSRLFDGPFSIPRTSTKNSIKQYYKSFKYFCIRFRPKKNPSHYESDHSNPIQQYDIFKDYENCTSTSLGDNSLLKSIGRVANRKSFSTVYLSFDEYINAVAASHSAPNLMPVSTISSAISTISLSLCKDSQAFTVSRSVSSATPDPNMSCTANLVNIVSKSEASYSSIAYTNKDTIFRNASGKMLANSVDLCHQQIDSVATNFTTKPEDRTGDCIPNCEPNASSTIFPSNNAQMTSNNTPLQNSSNHISNYHVNRLELEEVAQSPVLIVKPVRNIAEIINKKDSQEKRKIFSTTRKSFRDIFKLNKKKTALVSTAPNSTIFVDHKSDSVCTIILL
ncbi:MAG: hypothetical protein EXX96DRAFT_385961 [Benjaminiella poitrasii]|nr:MAG: hypothetical protein EXX96DRAFT_385961 [Benjaminiella poitrasii]